MRAEFNAYVAQCKDAGFTVDYYKGEKYFNASDADGYDLNVDFKEDYNEVGITLSAPLETPEPTAAPEPTETPEPTEEPEQETEEVPTSTAEENEVDARSDDDIRPEFKEAMDSYKEFFTEYVDFMNKYSESDGTDLALLADYTKFMSQYTETMQKLDDVDQSDLTNAELAYYLDTMNEINKMLLEVS